MLIENRAARILVVSLLILLLIPLVVMLGMMLFGSGMMAQMGDMQMAERLRFASWRQITRHRDIPSADMRSPLRTRR